MGQSLDQILADTADGGSVNVTIVSNEDDGVASYAVGDLVFRKGNLEERRPGFLERDPVAPFFSMFFSDRAANIPPPGSGLQRFRADETEQLGVSIQLGTTGTHVMQLTVFGTTSPVTLSPMGDLLVGLGPSLSRSAAGVFVVSFQAPSQIH
jgi:hypothetical protein